MAVLYQEIVRKKRDGQNLSSEDIGHFVAGITDGSATDAQISALAMAVYFQGLDAEETVALTMAMRDSGDVMTWPDMGRPIVDKHSTGGVGDNVSLMLAPMAAACGVCVPMISGRGLGHTGGTLDKMASIPGYNVQPDSQAFFDVTKDVGCAIIGQTSNLAPADKRFYGVRDVTATVENLSLITASILSKKLAAGLEWLVLDVKFGNGAFMDDLGKAKELAESLVRVANGAGTKTTALLTDMNEPLASAVGNAVEVVNAIEFLTGKRRDARLETVTVALATEMVSATQENFDLDVVEKQVRQKLDDGTAAEIFEKMVYALGGPNDVLSSYATVLAAAPVIHDVRAPQAGYVTNMSTRDIGIAVVEMGGGRASPDDDIDPAVGLSNMTGIGTKIEQGDRLFTIHAQSNEMAERAEKSVLAAYTFADSPPDARPIVAERIG